MHFWCMNIRTQLKNTSVRVIEIAPPTVGTNLHRERQDPDDNKKDKNSSALTVEEFMDDVIKAWKDDQETIGAGPSKSIIERWYSDFGSDYEKQNH